MTEFRPFDQRGLAKQKALTLTLVVLGPLGVAWGFQVVRPTGVKNVSAAEKAGPPQMRLP